MRIYLKLTPNTSPVPFSYQENLTGSFHKWIGINDIHDDLSFYSFSWLKGGKMNDNMLNFKDGAYWFISCWKEELLKKVINGIRKEPDMAYGMKVYEITICPDPDLSSVEQFILASPVLIKRNINSKQKHYEYTDNESDMLLTQTLLFKMDRAGIRDSSVKVSFNRNYLNAKVKVIDYKGISNKVNLCPVIIKGKSETKQFAWNVGLGNSTGIGFGAIK